MGPLFVTAKRNVAIVQEVSRAPVTQDGQAMACPASTLMNVSKTLMIVTAMLFVTTTPVAIHAAIVTVDTMAMEQAVQNVIQTLTENVFVILGMLVAVKSAVQTSTNVLERQTLALITPHVPTMKPHTHVLVTMDTVEMENHVLTLTNVAVWRYLTALDETSHMINVLTLGRLILKSLSMDVHHL
jgi:hypothetical protein